MSWGVFGSRTEAKKFPVGNQVAVKTPPLSILCSWENMLPMLELQVMGQYTKLGNIGGEEI